MTEELEQEPLPIETAKTERDRLKQYKDMINRHLPYMESDNKRRAKRTLKYLDKCIKAIGGDVVRNITW